MKFFNTKHGNYYDTTIESTDLDSNIDSPMYDGPYPEFMILLDKFKIETGFYELIKSAMTEIQPFLLPHVEYSPIELIGEPLWADLTSIAQRQGVLCLKHLATLPNASLLDESGCGISSFQLA